MLTSKNRLKVRHFLGVAWVVVLLGILLYAFLSMRSVSYVLRNPHDILKVVNEEMTNSRNLFNTVFYRDPLTVKLCNAIQRQDVSKMQRLIDAGADVNTKGLNGVPLLAWAYNWGEKGLECLLKNGADPNFILDRQYTRNVLLSSSGNTLLYLSIERSVKDRKYRNYVDVLLKYGADPDLGENKPLILAASRSELHDIFFKLVDAGADVNLPDEDSGTSPAMACVGRAEFELLLCLLEHGAEYDVNTPQGNELQRALYQIVNNDSFPGDKNRQIEQVKSWLEERGVSFEQEAPEL